jgi:hypothetical protein
MTTSISTVNNLHRHDFIVFDGWELGDNRSIITSKTKNAKLPLTTPLPWVVPVVKIQLWVPLFKHASALNHWTNLNININHDFVLQAITTGNLASLPKIAQQLSTTLHPVSVVNLKGGLCLQNIVDHVNRFYAGESSSLEWQKLYRLISAATNTCPCLQWVNNLTHETNVSIKRAKLLSDTMDDTPKIEAITIFNIKSADTISKQRKKTKPLSAKTALARETQKYTWVGILHFANVDTCYTPTVDDLIEYYNKPDTIIKK